MVAFVVAAVAGFAAFAVITAGCWQNGAVAGVAGVADEVVADAAAAAASVGQSIFGLCLCLYLAETNNGRDRLTGDGDMHKFQPIKPSFCTVGWQRRSFVLDSVVAAGSCLFGCSETFACATRQRSQ